MTEVAYPNLLSKRDAPLKFAPTVFHCPHDPSDLVVKNGTSIISDFLGRRRKVFTFNPLNELEYPQRTKRCQDSVLGESFSFDLRYTKKIVRGVETKTSALISVTPTFASGECPLVQFNGPVAQAMIQMHEQNKDISESGVRALQVAVSEILYQSPTSFRSFYLLKELAGLNLSGSSRREFLVGGMHAELLIPPRTTRGRYPTSAQYELKLTSLHEGKPLLYQSKGDYASLARWTETKAILK